MLRVRVVEDLKIAPCSGAVCRSALAPFLQVRNLINGVLGAEDRISCLKIIYLANAFPAPWNASLACGLAFADFRGWLSARALGFEELCGIDLYGPDAYVDRAKLSSFVSACKHLHRAGVLHDVLPSQSIDQHHYIGTKLLSLVYKSIAPGHERQCLPSLDPSCKRLASGLLELAFAFGGLCECLVRLLLDTAELSMPASGGSQRNIVSFYHGEYFYSLFSDTVNTELLKNLDLAVLECTNSRIIPSTRGRGF
ncbi:PREDICTED: DNA-dependent protein kinase catalytic subunit-like [Myotis brandtii]|uniref:DNA-dependent protein kinase catalytic subunit-like n=1 Tax=Myotis brandtii TaxID=109478 RepID=UPI0007045CA6|nr:PREDICTED: DNA-dependent protein kinase catalytic subunit-like [Myotis brandtii]